MLLGHRHSTEQMLLLFSLNVHQLDECEEMCEPNEYHNCKGTSLLTVIYLYPSLQFPPSLPLCLPAFLPRSDIESATPSPPHT